MFRFVLFAFEFKGVHRSIDVTFLCVSVGAIDFTVLPFI
jgi:hypothetical protein